MARQRVRAVRRQRRTWARDHSATDVRRARARWLRRSTRADRPRLVRVGARSFRAREQRVTVASMDAITILRDDHRTVEALFKKFEGLGERATKSKATIVEKLVRELSIHAAIEERLLYPVVREKITDKDDLALEALEEHLLVKIELSTL